MTKNTKNTKSTSVFSSAFHKVIKDGLDTYLEKDDFENCVSAYGLSVDKDVVKAAKEMGITNQKRLELLIMSAVAFDDISGVASRRGQNGGLHRVKVTRARKPATKKDKAPANETKPAETETPEVTEAPEAPVETVAETQAPEVEAPIAEAANA